MTTLNERVQLERYSKYREQVQDLVNTAEAVVRHSMCRNESVEVKLWGEMWLNQDLEYTSMRIEINVLPRELRLSNYYLSELKKYAEMWLPDWILDLDENGQTEFSINGNARMLTISIDLLHKNTYRGKKILEQRANQTTK